MGVVLRTSELPPEDRVEVVREAIWNHVLPVELEFDQSGEDLDLVCRLATAGPLNFSSARSTATAIHRTARLARGDHEARLFLAIQVAGTTMVTQGSSTAVLHRGEMALYDSTKPYSVINTDDTELHYFQIPRDALALPQRAVDQVLAARISADNNPLAALAGSFFASLGAGDVLDQPGAALAVAEPSIGLLRALVATHLSDPDLARPALEDSLVLRVQQFIATHLRDRGLTATRIATAHHISVRHLYATMARAGISVHDTIQAQRLEACRRDLRHAKYGHLAVATIGARWGFVDPSHFGRAFKSSYGLTPTEWRAGGA